MNRESMKGSWDELQEPLGSCEIFGQTNVVDGEILEGDVGLPEGLSRALWDLICVHCEHDWRTSSSNVYLK